MRVFLFLACLFVFTCMGGVFVPTADAQTNSGGEFGVTGFYQSNTHDVDIRGIPDPVCCDRNYTTGEGSGFTGGVFYRRFLGKSLSVSMHVLYSDFSGELTETEESQTTVVGGEVVNAVFENKIKTTFHTIGIEPRVEYHFMGMVTLAAGCHLGVFAAKDYTETEYMLSPEGYTFMDGTRYRKNVSGDLPNAADILFSGVIALSGRIPVHSLVTLVPEVSYLHSFTDVMKETVWKTHAIRAGISLAISL